MNMRTTSPSSARARWRGCAATALAVVIASGTALIGAPAQAVPQIPSAVFDPDSVAWRSYRDQTGGAFANTFQQNVRDGYLIIDLEIDVIGNDYRVGSAWQRNLDGRNWQELRDLSGTEFHQAWLDAKRRGMRVTEQETYYVDGKRKFAAVWVDNVENLGWASHRGLTSAQAVDAFEKQRRAGRMPIDIDQYLVDGSMRYSMVWVDNAESLGWEMHTSLTYDEFEDVYYNNYNNADRRLIAFESVKVGSVQRYSGIWIDNLLASNAVHLRFDMTADSYDTFWEHASVGHRLVSYDKYVTPDGVRYASIWRLNN